MMVLVWKRFLLFTVLVSMLGIAGCIGDEPTPEPAAGDEPDPADAIDKTDKSVPVPTESKKVLSKVDSKEAVFAPTWTVGQWWTFDVSGEERPAGTATFAVTELAEDHYKLGSDSELELAFNNLRDGPFLPRGTGGVQFDSFALYHAESYQDFVGFRRPVGDTWDITMLDNKYTVTKEAVQEVEDPTGTSMGIMVSGAAPNENRIEIVYSAKAMWLSEFRILYPDGSEFLSYKLTDYGSSGGPEVKRWQRADGFRLNAQSPFYMADASAYESDGSGDRLVVILALRNGLPQGESHASVHTPTGEEAATGTVKVGILWQYTFLDDAAGNWPVRVHALGGDEADVRAKTDVWLLQMKQI